jgi:hypothetical protein
LLRSSDPQDPDATLRKESLAINNFVGTVEIYDRVFSGEHPSSDGTQGSRLTETCYISAHFQIESTTSGSHIRKMVEDIQKILFAPRSQRSFKKSHQSASVYLSPLRIYASKISLGGNFIPLTMEGLRIKLSLQ